MILIMFEIVIFRAGPRSLLEEITSCIIRILQIIFWDKLHPETLCEYVFAICWPQQNLLSSNSYKNSRKSVTWSVVPDAPKLVYVGMRL